MSAWSELLEDPAVREDHLGDRARTADAGRRVTVAVSGGAGGIAGAARLAARHRVGVRALEITLRDLDDLAGNARRVTSAVDAARADGTLAEDVPVRVVLPPADPGHGWLAAADEVAMAELHLGLRTGAPEPDLIPPGAWVAAWIDAALDRELPYACGGGPHVAVRGDDGHGVLNLLLATRTAFDGASTDDVAGLLDLEDRDRLAALAVDADLAAAQRWLTSVATPGGDAVEDELTSLTGRS